MTFCFTSYCRPLSVSWFLAIVRSTIVGVHIIALLLFHFRIFILLFFAIMSLLREAVWGLRCLISVPVSVFVFRISLSFLQSLSPEYDELEGSNDPGCQLFVVNFFLACTFRLRQRYSQYLKFRLLWICSGPSCFFLSSVNVFRVWMTRLWTRHHVWSSSGCVSVSTGPIYIVFPVSVRKTSRSLCKTFSWRLNSYRETVSRASKAYNLFITSVRTFVNSSFMCFLRASISFFGIAVVDFVFSRVAFFHFLLY